MPNLAHSGGAAQTIPDLEARWRSQGFKKWHISEQVGRYGRPAIFNTDQGAQFTTAAFTGLLQEHGIAISMDGQGCWKDNIFVERLWRSIKYEEVYLHAYASVSDARAGIGRYLGQYNAARPHSSLADQTPDEAYFTPRLQQEAA